MSFIRAQRIIYSPIDNKTIIGGTASIIDSVYVESSKRKNNSDGKYNDKYHSKQIVKEKLGKIISLSEDRKSGIFLSPTRGMIEYNVTTDIFRKLSEEEIENIRKGNLKNKINDKRIEDNMVLSNKYTQVHTIFGDTYFLLKFLKNIGMLDILKKTFGVEDRVDFKVNDLITEEKGKGKEQSSDNNTTTNTHLNNYKRSLCHILHGILKDGSKITCDNFILKSFASYFLIPDNINNTSSLRSDIDYYSLMGNDDVKIRFFKNFIKSMREVYPEFGLGCYIDSSSLPNSISDNPFNALSSHGVNGTSSIQTRLVLVLDQYTSLPVWYTLIPGNVLDVNTINNVLKDALNTLDVKINSFVLDAGYISSNLIEEYNNNNKKKQFIGRMPFRKGYPYRELYNEIKPFINKSKYNFIRNNHTYFAKCKTIKLFEKDIYAYIFIDKHNALDGFTKYMKENEEEYYHSYTLTNKEKDWLMVKDGFFILLSNMDKEAKDILDDYINRVQIESIFKTSKEYLNILPLSKWNIQTINGKILNDIINTIIYLLIRKMLSIYNNTGYCVCEKEGEKEKEKENRKGNKENKENNKEEKEDEKNGKCNENNKNSKNDNENNGDKYKYKNQNNKNNNCNYNSCSIMATIINNIKSSSNTKLKSTTNKKKKKYASISATEVIGKTQSLMCFRNSDCSTITIETPNVQVKTYYKIFGIDIPNHLSLKELKKEMLM